MMARITIDDLPYPYCNLPKNGKPLHLLQMYDTAKPLLAAVKGMLETCAVAAAAHELPVEDIAPLFSVLAGQIAMVELLLERVEH